MKRITAIALVAAAIIGCSYVGPASASSASFDATMAREKMVKIVEVHGVDNLGFGQGSARTVVNELITEQHGRIADSLIAGYTCDEIVTEVKRNFRSVKEQAAKVPGAIALSLEMINYTKADCTVTAVQVAGL